MFIIMNILKSYCIVKSQNIINYKIVFLTGEQNPLPVIIKGMIKLSLSQIYTTLPHKLKWGIPQWPSPNLLEKGLLKERLKKVKKS